MCSLNLYCDVWLMLERPEWVVSCRVASCVIDCFYSDLKVVNCLLERYMLARIEMLE